MKYLFLALLLATQTSHACINIKGVTSDGDYRMVSGDSYVETLKLRMAADPSSKLHATPGYPYEHYALALDWTDAEDEGEAEAVRLILTGEYAGAIAKLEAMEAANPGDYSTAANLGTAYELAGNNEAALKWIREGIKRNEHSHYGTEWLHVAILETKLAMEADPAYLATRHILPVEEEKERPLQYSLVYGGEAYSGDRLIKALYYQLGERMLFVKPADPVVADLLYTLALVEVNARVLEPAVELLALAKEYGYPDVADIDARMARYQEMIDSTWKLEGRIVVNSIMMLVLFSLPVILLFILGRAVYRFAVSRRVAGAG